MKNIRLIAFVRLMMFGFLVQMGNPLGAVESYQINELKEIDKQRKARSEQSIHKLVPTVELREQIVLIDDEQLELFVSSFISQIAQKNVQDTISEEVMLFCEQLLLGKKEFSISFLCKVMPQLLVLIEKIMEQERAPRPGSPGFQDGSIVGPLLSCDFEEVLELLNQIFSFLVQCCTTVENDFNGTFTFLAEIENTLTTCCATVENDLNGVFTALSSLTVTVTVDFTDVFTTLDSINTTLTTCCVNIDNDFNGTFTYLAEIENTLTICCSTVENDLNGVFTTLSSLAVTATVDLTDVFTTLNAINTTLTTCCVNIDNDFNGTFTYLAEIESTLTACCINISTLIANISACSSLTITQSLIDAAGGTYTISSPGNYVLASDITSTSPSIIVINSNGVTFNLCNHSIVGGSVANQTGITVNSALSDIAIINGAVINMSQDGIFVNSGVSNISISNLLVNNTGRSGINFEGNIESLITQVTIDNCTISLTATAIGGISGLVLANCDEVIVEGGNFNRNGSLLASVAGVLIDASTNCAIDAATMNLNTSTGLLIIDTQNSSVSNTVLSRNTGSGIDLSGCSFNTFNNCTVSRITASVGNGAYGIRALSGNNNIFENCIVDGISTAEAMNNFEATGILIGNDELSDTIINNQITNITSAGSLPFGIHMDYTFTELISSDLPFIATGTVVNKVLWSPNDKYLAVNYYTGGDTVGVYAHDQSITDLVQVASVNPGDVPVDLAWSPDGTYLATVESNGANGILRVFFFNGVSLTQTSSAIFAAESALPQAVTWSANGRFIAVVGNLAALNTTLTDPLIYVFEFTGSALNQVSSASAPFVVNDIAWGPQNNYLAAGEVGLLAVYKFTGGNTLTLTASMALGTDSANTVDWAIDGRTLVISNTAGFSVIDFNGTALTTIDSVITGTLVNDARWSSDGNYVLIGQQDSTAEAYLYDAINTPALTLISSYSRGAPVQSVDWSNGGEFIAIAGDSNGTNKTVELLSGLVFPYSMIIRGNEVSGVQGPALASGLPGFSSGRGISASSNSNLIIQNTAFNNDVNYVFATNIYSQFIANTASQFPNNLANLSFPPL